MLSRCLCIVVMFLCSNASAQWEQISHDSTINCLYADSHVLYAGSYFGGGLLASGDSGLHWNVLFRTYEIDDLHSYHGKVFVAAGGAGVYAYDHDTTVQLTKKYCFSFADDGMYLYCGSQGCALRFDGSVWELDSIPCRNVSCGAIASYAAPKFELMASTYGDLVKSTDHGRTWRMIDSEASVINTITSWHNTLFSGSWNDIWQSFDDGETWSVVPFPRHSAYYHLRSTDKYLLCISDSGFFYTSDGSKWINATEGLPDSVLYSSWLCVEEMDGYVYVSIEGGGSYGSLSGLWRRPLSDLDNADVHLDAANDLSAKAYPNPFSDATTICVGSTSPSPVHITWSNALGEEVAASDRMLTAGMNEITFDANEEPSGVYFCRISSPRFSKVISIIKK